MLNENLCLLICSLIFLFIFLKPLKRGLFSILTDRVNKISADIEYICKLKNDVNLQINLYQEKVNNLPSVHEKMLTDSQLFSEKLVRTKRLDLEKFLERQNKEIGLEVLRLKNESVLFTQRKMMELGYIRLVTAINNNEINLPIDFIIFKNLVRSSVKS